MIQLVISEYALFLPCSWRDWIETIAGLAVMIYYIGEELI